MSKEKQIEEMALIICGFKDCTSCISRMGLRKCGAKAYAERFYNAGYRKQSEGEWVERPDLGGFVCSNGCGGMYTEIKETDILPKFCPNCGTKMKNGFTLHEHVELLYKRLCGMKGGE